MQADLIASTEVQVVELRPLSGNIPGTGLDILFVHGSLWNDTARARGSRGAWEQRDNPHVCWPEVWLPADLGIHGRILTVSYNDVALREKDIPKQDIADVIAHELCHILFPWYNQISYHFIIRNLSDCSSDPLAVLLCECVRLSHSAEAVLLCCASRSDSWGLGREHPVVLVGHEFGGNVIKSLVMEAKGIVTNTRPPRSSIPYWGLMSGAEEFVRNVVQIFVYARQRVHDNWELNKDGSIDDSCSLFLCNPKSRFVEVTFSNCIPIMSFDINNLRRLRESIIRK